MFNIKSTSVSTGGQCVSILLNKKVFEQREMALKVGVVE